MSWDIVKLGDIATFVNGYPFKPTDWSNSGKEIIRIQNLTKSSGESNFFEGTIPEKYKVTKGDVLISWSATLDIFKWDGDDAWLNQHIFKVVFDKREIDKRFFNFLIQHVLDDLKKQVHGATMKHITKGKFDNTPVPLPPLSTQKRIAEILDTADALRRKDQELLRKYDELAQAIFIDMFGDPVRNEKGWEVKKLGDICTKITDGTHDTPERLTSGVKFITGKHIRPYTIDYKNSDYVTEEIHKEIYRRCNPEIGDILYTNIGVNYATAAMNTVEYEFSMKNVALLKYNRKIITGRFLEYLLNNEFFKDKLKKLTGIGGAQQFLSLAQIKDINILVPSKSLQNKFDIIIDGLTPATNNLNIANNKSEFLFLSLLQKAFKGELIS